MNFSYETSAWVNPTKDPVKLDLCINANAEEKKADKRLRITIPQAGTVMPPAEVGPKSPHVVDKNGRLVFTRLPVELDMGIHHVRDGVIVGGQGMRLKRYIAAGDEETEHLPLAAGLDSAEEDRKTAVAEAQAMLEQKKAADEALLIAAANQLKAEQKISEQDKPLSKAEQKKAADEAAGKDGK